MLLNSASQVKLRNRSRQGNMRRLSVSSRQSFHCALTLRYQLCGIDGYAAQAGRGRFQLQSTPYDSFTSA